VSRVLPPPPIKWSLDGGDYALRAPEIDEELLFQTAQEAFAVERIEATRGRVGDDATERRHAALAELVFANKFAFGGRLSRDFAGSVRGLAEYVLILSRHTGARPLPPLSRLLEWLGRAKAGDEADHLARAIYERDFGAVYPKEPAPGDGASSPSQASPPASASGATAATPADSTSASS
jgi:hypothetical protein